MESVRIHYAGTESSARGDSLKIVQMLFFSARLAKTLKHFENAAVRKGSTLP